MFSLKTFYILTAFLNKKEEACSHERDPHYTIAILFYLLKIIFQRFDDDLLTNKQVKQLGNTLGAVCILLYSFCLEYHNNQ